MGNNTVTSFDDSRPGIYVPENKTLTIQGDGSLTASVHSDGSWSAGIGGGFDFSTFTPQNCGNIVLSGGTIIANGGTRSAGIGSVYRGRCGDITIGSDIIRVIATRGPADGFEDQVDAIGAGLGGNCGTVTVAPELLDTTSGATRTILSWDGNLSTLTSDATAYDGMVITGTLGGNYKVSIAPGATVVLSNANITCGSNNSDYSWAGLTCLGSATLVLEGDNAIKGFYEDYPGIYVTNNAMLTISGTGSLTAYSNGWGAGIGAAYHIPCGEITIESGTIYAYGGSLNNLGEFNSANSNAAGIGGAKYAACGYITIRGGNIFAAGGLWNAGIGGGYLGACADIRINGGTVEAVGGACAAGIGTGKNPASFCDVGIAAEITRVVATCGEDCNNPIGAGLNDEHSTASVNSLGLIDSTSGNTRTIQPWDGDLATLTSDIVARDGTVITGTLLRAVKMSIADDARVTISNATIEGITGFAWAGLTCRGDAEIVLSGTNTVKGFDYTYPGIHVPSGSTLTISGTGALDASSNGSGAGIGGGYQLACGNIVIASGTITATGGNWAAGIGGGESSDCGDITITGGTITATGGSDAAGIGGGYDGSSGTIAIGAGITRVVATRGEDFEHDPIYDGAAAFSNVPSGLTDTLSADGSTRTIASGASGYTAWATANSVSGAWNALDANGVANVFRYAFNLPTGDAAILGIRFNEAGKAVITTPPQVNSAGFTFTVVASDSVDGTEHVATYPLDPLGTGETVIDETPSTSRFFRLRAVTQ